MVVTIVVVVVVIADIGAILVVVVVVVVVGAIVTRESFGEELCINESGLWWNVCFVSEGFGIPKSGW